MHRITQRITLSALAALCAAGVAGGLLAEAAGPPAASAAVGPREYPALVLKGKLKRTIAWEKLPTSVTWDGTKAGNINPGLRAKYTTSKNKASFSPSWPLKLVGADLASGGQKIGGINLISLLPAPVTAR